VGHCIKYSADAARVMDTRFPKPMSAGIDNPSCHSDRNRATISENQVL
jgi:hypothetical protein